MVCYHFIGDDAAEELGDGRGVEGGAGADGVFVGCGVDLGGGEEGVIRAAIGAFYPGGLLVWFL